jgi:hypothetical protein
MTQREKLEKLRVILIELKEFLKIASEACQEAADEHRLVDGTAAEKGYPDLLVEGGTTNLEGERNLH